MTERQWVTRGGLSRFSPAGFVAAAVTVGVGTTAGLAAVPVAGSYLGMLLGGFVAGLAVEDRPVLEGGVAAVVATLGVLAAGGFVGSGVAGGVAALAAVAPLTLLISVALSFAVGGFGAHLGDDLRHGLTEAGEAPSSGPTSLGPVLTTDDTSRRDRESTANTVGGTDTETTEDDSEELDLELE